jgi:hypothetical protein
VEAAQGLGLPKHLEAADDAFDRIEHEFELHALCNGAPNVIRLLGGVYSGQGRRLLKLVHAEAETSLECLIARR